MSQQTYTLGQFIEMMMLDAPAQRSVVYVSQEFFELLHQSYELPANSDTFGYMGKYGRIEFRCRNYLAINRSDENKRKLQEASEQILKGAAAIDELFKQLYPEERKP